MNVALSRLPVKLCTFVYSVVETVALEVYRLRTFVLVVMTSELRLYKGAAEKRLTAKPPDVEKMLTGP